MRVLVDGFYYDRPYGFGRYVRELVSALAAHAEGIELVLAVSDAGTASNAFPRGVADVIVGPSWDFIRWEQLYIPHVAHRLKCSVVHFPSNTMSCARRGLKSVLTVHDLMFLDEHVPLFRTKDYVYQQYSRALFSITARKADVIIAPSRATVSQLSCFGLPATVIYPSIDAFLRVNRIGDLVPERPYLLHRGGSSPHRNTATVLEAFRLARAAKPGLMMLVLGAPNGADIYGTGEDEDVRFLPRVSDMQLAALYERSECVVASSRREGFGLTILEGFGFGTPVVTSEVEPMTEIAGEAALLADPYSAESIACKIVAILRDPSLRRRLVASGRRRMEAFSATRFAAALCQAYQRAAQTGAASSCGPEGREDRFDL